MYWKSTGSLKLLLPSWYYLNIVRKDARDVNGNTGNSGQFILKASWPEFWFSPHTALKPQTTPGIPSPGMALGPSLSAWGPGAQFLTAGPLPGGGIRGQFSRQPTASQQLFLISYRREVVRPMEVLHGLESTPKLSVGPDSVKSLGY